MELKANVNDSLLVHQPCLMVGRPCSLYPVNPGCLNGLLLTDVLYPGVKPVDSSGCGSAVRT